MKVPSKKVEKQAKNYLHSQHLRSARHEIIIIHFMFSNNHFFTFTTAVFAIAAIFSSCSSDSTSANETGTSEGIVKTDTVYVPIKDTVYIPVKDTGKVTSSESALIASSTTMQTSSTTVPVSSATEATSSATAQSSESENPASSASTPASSTATDENLLWSDEFEGSAIDETKWGYNIGTGENGWGNSELEYYTNRPENVYVKDGMLHIRAQKEDYEGQKYTSTRLLSQNKFTFTYGTVEARIALPVGKGIWPAFWMLGENIEDISWPACGEIDIIEAINDESIVYGTHHWAHEGSHAQYGNSTADHHGSSTKIDISEFHIYKMVWNKEFIEMYVDDFMYQKIDITDAAGEMGTFHKPFFFILNVAVGGTWPGFDIDDSQFPTEMQVDYIRVYKN